MKQCFFKTIRSKITGKRIAAPEGMCTQDGGIQILCKHKLYVDDSYKDIVTTMLKKEKLF